jgi:hypothetical protein
MPTKYTRTDTKKHTEVKLDRDDLKRLFGVESGELPQVSVSESWVILSWTHEEVGGWDIDRNLSDMPTNLMPPLNISK